MITWHRYDRYKKSRKRNERRGHVDTNLKLGLKSKLSSVSFLFLSSMTSQAGLSIYELIIVYDITPAVEPHEPP